MKKASQSGDVKDVPAPAATVLNRPDPIEKPPSTIGTADLHPADHENPPPDCIYLDEVASLEPPYVFSRDANPFDDGNSIQTAGTGGTNVIPIALVSPDQRASIRSGTDSNSSLGSGPIRPARSPELTLNYDHVNVSENNLHPGNYEPSTRSGVSAVSSARQSYMSGMTYASDFLTEAPMIITPSKGPIRQVLGVAKPEVISAGTLSRSPSNSNTLRPPAYTKPSAKSPLAATSFGPNDAVQESDELLHPGNPFDDRHSSTNAEYSLSPPPSATTIYTARQDRDSTGSTWTPDGPTLPWAKGDDNSRPSSLSTQAGSVIDIASATRVNVGLMTPGTASSGKTGYRTTMGRLVTPSTGASAGSLQEQQARALAHAQAQAEAQGLGKPRPISGSSAISATSTRADSILESFPFVPPSPISNRPVRSPPVSPLVQSFGGAATSPLAQHAFVVAPPSPLANAGFSPEHPHSDEDGSLPAPPTRKMLGMSTASQMSTASTGLGSFPFQIDSGSDRPDSTLQPPVPFNRQRASLDTLALTSDLSSYPLGFDRAGGPPPRKDKI
ncbi:hypothetical protein EST38_g602 [Candolleomyces aberdarensis]|uniref:Uncharacterized protein n=1 Tax=Candolleomyces aberdarensis TaxID=2316362 RepID=A0A4Q2E082_9AGAR|nr:hypothetical protein EST38_g602 [Candolleomyces aberdarensis]